MGDIILTDFNKPGGLGHIQLRVKTLSLISDVSQNQNACKTHHESAYFPAVPASYCCSVSAPYSHMPVGDTLDKTCWRTSLDVWQATADPRR